MGKWFGIAAIFFWGLACGDASLVWDASPRDASREAGSLTDGSLAVDAPADPRPAVDSMDGHAAIVPEAGVLSDTFLARDAVQAPDAPDPVVGCAGTFVACGCGCCGPNPGSGAEPRCYYPGEGDNLSTIMAKDLAIRGAPSCENVGCSLGILYQCCMPQVTAASATYSVTTTIGGLDRLTIDRVGEDGVCATLVLASPVAQENAAFRLSLPASYQVEAANSGSCGSARTQAMGAVGTVTLRPSGTTCLLDARFSLFLPSISGQATAVRFEATGIAVPELSSNSCVN